MEVDLEDLPQRSEVDRRVAERLKVAATVDSNWFDRIGDMNNRSAWIGSKAIGKARRCVSVELVGFRSDWRLGRRVHGNDGTYSSRVLGEIVSREQQRADD